ncbi:hypothetical protein DUI87_07582 [Hirundo rustica rustica]|uniref:Uncharacterized protein n=1 Tax=Hirundo rustica rustica TaxID=333673 RepID=A0A3M0KRU6_HIRRU|nr:hypothetical protein DUI87_07582 [Hirundo rustica rustica]
MAGSKADWEQTGGGETPMNRPRGPWQRVRGCKVLSERKLTLGEECENKHYVYVTIRERLYYKNANNQKAKISRGVPLGFDIATFDIIQNLKLVINVCVSVPKQQEKFFIPLINLMASFGLTLAGPCPSCAVDPRAGCSSPGGISPERSRGQNSLPCPADHAAFDPAWDMVGFLGSECTLPGHIQSPTHQHPQVLLIRIALDLFIHQPILRQGVALTQFRERDVVGDHVKGFEEVPVYNICNHSLGHS